MFYAVGQRASVGMRRHEQPEEEPRDGRSEETLAAVFDDLEMQADGLHLSERAVEVAELSVAQDAELDLLSRFHGCVGSVVRVGTCDGQEVRGTLAGAGGDWVMVDEAATTCFVPLHAVALVAGLGREAVPVQGRALPSRLSFRSVLRRLADEAEPCA